MFKRITAYLKGFFAEIRIRNVRGLAMSTLADVQTHLNQVADGVTNLRGQIQTLKDQLASGQVVTQEQLDALDTSVQAIVTAETQP